MHIWRLLVLTFGLAWPTASSALPQDRNTVVPSLQASTDGAACKLPRPSAGSTFGEGFGPRTSCAPSTGSLNAFMFFVDFPDQVANGTGIDSPVSLTEFFAPATEWYRNSSYGRLNLNITSDTSKYYRMSELASSYGFERTLSGNMHVKYIQDAADAFLAGGGKPPTTPYDVVYIVPTRNATAITFSPTSSGKMRSRSGVTFSNFGAITVGMDAYRRWQYKVLNHETGHSMCLPDLYPEGRAVGEYVGGWDMMGYILGSGPDYFAWHKWKIGWIDDGQVDCISGAGSTNHTIYPLEVASKLSAGAGADTKAVVIRRNNTAALVVEVRAKLGVDTSACATGAVLYTVNATPPRGTIPIRVLDSTPGSGGCGGQELSDGTLNLEKVKSFAVPGWNTTITVTEQKGEALTISIDVA